MKIAIVGPSPVPYTIGGMEKLAWQMTEKINEITDYQAELIKLPSKEMDFWSLIDTYFTFSQLDLSHFDLVISTKYPSWMVKHPNHVCYMIHKLRGLYDTYHFTRLSTEVNSKSKYTQKLVDYLNKTWQKPDEKALWEELNEYRTHIVEIPQEDTSFPGPLIRLIIHYLDNLALHPSRIKRYGTMSKTVANRKDYFPSGIQVFISNPPPTNYISGIISYGDYFFTVSRLDNAKRVEMLLKATEYLDNSIKLVVAGSGPQEGEFRSLFQDNHRIELLGYCSDEKVNELYNNCLAVLYVPFEEDYGLVTMEAFLRGKAVITCYDSGGPTEFVVNHHNGFIVQPKPENVASAMKNLWTDRQLARDMGQRGLEVVKGINWERFVSELILDSSAQQYNRVGSKKRPKMLVTTTFPIYPPKGGGQSRIFNLYKHVAKEYDVEILSFTNHDQPSYQTEIAPGLKELRFPKTKRHQEKEWEIEQKAGIPVSDVAMPILSKYTPIYGETLRERADKADIVVISHPYLYDEVENIRSNIKLIYEAHNVEYDLKSKVFPSSEKYLLEEVFRIEKLCCENSELIMTCSEEDAKRLAELYHVNPEKFIVVPNGVDTSEVSYVSSSQRIENKKKLGLEKEFLVLFMGSWHPPNLEACREIFKIAQQLPKIKFLLVGSQCLAFANEKIPSNIGLLGVVEEDEKDLIMGIVDIALNPMLTGSGTNLKMFDYMAAGIPVITTEFGARGIGAVNGEHLIISDVEEMPQKTNELMQDNSEKKEQLGQKGYELVREKFDWNRIASILCQKINKTQQEISNLKIDEYCYRPTNISHKFEECVNKIRDPKILGCIDNSKNEIIKNVLFQFAQAGYKIKTVSIDVNDYQSYIKNAKYSSLYPDYYSDNFYEKTLEHYLTSVNLNLRSGEVFIDIASEHSPLPEIFKRLFKATTYSQDIMYPKGIHGNRIGGDACDMPIPDNFADKMCLTCSLEHFESDADSRLIQEIKRVLKPGGICYIVPLYLFDKHAIQTDPTVSVPNNVLFDEGAIVYCCKNWGNRHGRFYDYNAFKNRIEPYLDQLMAEIQYIKNIKELNNSCYAYFALKLTKK